MDVSREETGRCSAYKITMLAVIALLNIQHALAANIGASAATHSNLLINIVDKDKTAMNNMVVYLMPEKQPQLALNPAEKSINTTPKAVTNPVEIHQKDKQFSPYITVVQQGHELEFINDDDITHHIYSALGPKRFSFKLRQDDATKMMLFDKAGHVPMGCNIHDWMSGHILVVDTPYFGASNSAGTVRFNALPAGRYSAIVWHPQLQAPKHQQSFAVDITNEQQSLTLDVITEMSSIPQQKSFDDFEFLEGY